MPRWKLQTGHTYRVWVRASRLEKLVVNHANMLRLLAESGLTDVKWQATKEGFEVQGRYYGPSGAANLPARVTRVARIVAAPPVALPATSRKIARAKKRPAAQY